MGLWGSTSAEELADAMRGRRERADRRLISIHLMAAVYWLILPWQVLLGWLTVCWALQGLEYWSLHPRRQRMPQEPSTVVWSLMTLAGQSLVWGWLGLEVVWGAADIGPTLGMTHLVTVILVFAMGSRTSWLAFWAGVTPLAVLILVVVPGLMMDQGVPVTQLLALVAGCAVTLAVTLSFWREHAQLFRSEAAAREAALSASAAKSTFIAMVSHELRTPISAIHAGALDLERLQPDAALRKRATLIVDAGRMMRTLLDDLLDLSKVEAGRMGVEVIAFDARALVADSLRFWQAQARKKGLRLRVEGGRNLPRQLVTDPTRLRQILNNLFSNAMKFTDSGSVTLCIQADAANLRLTVEDDGVGMSTEQMERLFTPFSQASKAVARTHGGTGLGLALSRDLARLMNGDLTVDSAPGQGSHFTLTHPITVGPPLGTTQSPSPAIEQEVPPARLLVVDDHEINLRAMGVLLEAMGASASFAASGPVALERLTHETFDVVLLDVHMPGMDGLEVARSIRLASGPNQAVPIVAVTGATEPKDRARCQDAGMTDCIAKPVEPAELHAALMRALA